MIENRRRGLRELRNLLDAALPTDTELEAFALDFFPGAQREWSAGMERSRKITLLFERIDDLQILHALHGHRPEIVKQRWPHFDSAGPCLAKHSIPARTETRSRAWRVVRLLSSLSVPAVLGFVVSKRVERAERTAVATPMAPSRSTDSVRLRQKLNESFAKSGEPLAPDSCQERAPLLLGPMLRASAELANSRVGGTQPHVLMALGTLRQEVEVNAAESLSAELLVLLARAHLAASADTEAAYPLVVGAITKCPTYALAHNVLGNVDALRRDWPAAADAYREALRIEPTFLAPRLNLGTALLHQGLPERALIEFEQILQRAPEHADGLHARGLAQLALGQATRAVMDLQTAARLAPANGDVWQSLGEALQRANQPRRARDAYCQAARLGQLEATPHCRANE